MSVLGYLRTFVRARPGVVVLSLSLWLAQSLAELAPGLIVKRFFDALQQQAFAQATQSVLLLLAFAAGFAGIVMATAVASARLRFHVSNALRRGILEAILQQSPGAARPSVGAALATTRDDPPALATVVAIAVDQISIVIFTVVALALMVRIDPLITAVAVAPVAVVLVVSQLTRRRVGRLRTRSRQAAADATGFMVDALSAWQTIQLGGAQEAVAGRLARLDGERGRWAIRDHLFDRTIRAAFAATSTVGSGLVLAVAGGAMRAGDFSVGDFALFASYLTFLGEFAAEFGGLLLQYRQARVSWRRIGALSGVTPSGHWNEAARPLRGAERRSPPRNRDDDASENSRRRGPATTADRVDSATGPEPLRELRIKDLRVRYRARGTETTPHAQVADAIDLTLRGGELIAVTGRVGAGKSTLLKALVGLAPLDSGAFLWNGQAVRNPLSWFRYPVCTYVPQEPHLFSVSIRENVVLEPNADTDERTEAVDCRATSPPCPGPRRGAPAARHRDGGRQRGNEALRRPAPAAGVGARVLPRRPANRAGRPVQRPRPRHRARSTSAHVRQLGSRRRPVRGQRHRQGAAPCRRPHRRAEPRLSRSHRHAPGVARRRG